MLLLPLLLPLALAGSADGYLGIRVDTGPDGVRVDTVLPGGGAEAAGLSEGDLILSVDGEPLAGLASQEATALLRGEPGSRARLVIQRFPGGGKPETVRVTRGPLAPEETKVSAAPPPATDRVGTALLGAVRAGRPIEPGSAVRTWAAADHAVADPALLRFLRRADVEAFDPAQRTALWTALGSDPAFRDLLAFCAPGVRLDAARVLAAHAGSAALALDLLTALPPEAGAALREDATRLARAVLTGDPAAVAALAIQGTDLVGPGGFHAAFGVRLSDRAALELAQEAAGTDGGPPPSLPADAVRRLEATGTTLPWTPRLDPPAFGMVEALPAPPLSVDRVDGGRLDLAAHPGPLVVSFWASWCGPCRQELPRLQALVASLADTGLELWAISVDKDPKLVPPAVETFGLTGPVGLARRATLAAWGVKPVPRLFVLDADHRVLLDHTGYSDERFDEVAREIEAIARGQRGATRSLGRVLEGPQAVALLGSGPVEPRPLALAVDAGGGMWATLAGQAVLAPVRLDGAGAVVVDPAGGVPLPFDADRVHLADLDGDGTEEVIAARAGGAVVRAGRADGTTLWTSREPDPVTDLGIAAGPDGHPRVVVLRSRSERLPGPPGGPAEVAEPRARIALLDGRGHEVGRAVLEGRIGELTADPAVERVFAVLPDGGVVSIGAAGDVAPVPAGPDPARSVALTDLDGDRAPDLLVGSRWGKDAWAGAFGPGGTRRVVALTGGGDVVGLDTDGAVRVRLDLQRPPIALPGDLDGDGREELVVWAPWYGFAAVRVE